MKLSIDKKSFIKILQMVQGIVEKRNSMPILSNILLDASDGKINIIATDLEIFVKDSCEAAVEENGSITVNCKKFFEIIKELPEDEISLKTTEGDKLTVTSGRSRFNIPGLPAKEFPAFPAVDTEALSDVDSDTFKEMIDKTLFATSTDETRYNINGILFERIEGKLKMVATDGHRLALMESAGSEIEGHQKGVILPRKGVMEIKKILEEREDSLKVGFTGNNVTLQKGTSLLNVRLIEGEFPDYKQVIPEITDKKFTVERSGFLAGLKRVSILSSDKVKGVKFSLSSGKLVLSSSTPENGDALEEVDITYDGADLEIAFNAKYFIEALEVMDDPEVKVELKEQLNPGILRSAGTDDFTYVIMPMRL